MPAIFSLSFTVKGSAVCCRALARSAASAVRMSFVAANSIAVKRCSCRSTSCKRAASHGDSGPPSSWVRACRVASLLDCAAAIMWRASCSSSLARMRSCRSSWSSWPREPLTHEARRSSWSSDRPIRILCVKFGISSISSSHCQVKSSLKSEGHSGQVWGGETLFTKSHLFAEKRSVESTYKVQPLPHETGAAVASFGGLTHRRGVTFAKTIVSSERHTPTRERTTSKAPIDHLRPRPLGFLEPHETHDEAAVTATAAVASLGGLENTCVETTRGADTFADKRSEIARETTHRLREEKVSSVSVPGERSEQSSQPRSVVERGSLRSTLNPYPIPRRAAITRYKKSSKLNLAVVYFCFSVHTHSSRSSVRRLKWPPKPSRAKLVPAAWVWEARWPGAALGHSRRNAGW